jgi:hypothetical protein
MVASKFPEMKVAFPGAKFTPPGNGEWLEVAVFRNIPIDGANPDFCPLDRGILQITVCTRPGAGILRLIRISDRVRASFPKGSEFNDGLKITTTPYNLSVITDDDRIMLPVSMSYST